MLAYREYEKGITLVQNKNAVPVKILHDERILVVAPESKVYTIAEEEVFAAYPLAQVIRSHHSQVEEVRVQIEPSEQNIQTVLQKLEHVKWAIVGTMNAHLIEAQAKLVHRMKEQGKTIIVVALRNPYDYTVVPDVDAFIAAYEYTLPALQAVANVLFGTTAAKGKLPVMIPKLKEC